jgi:hypothetical protein
MPNYLLFNVFRYLSKGTGYGLVDRGSLSNTQPMGLGGHLSGGKEG